MAFLILLIVIIILLLLCLKIVPQAYCYVVERLGKYHAIWGAGVHFLLPIIDRVVNKISLKEQVLDFPPQPVITKDNVTMQIDSVVYAKVFDPEKFTYGVENPMRGLQNLTATTLRNVVGEMELDQTLTSRDQINEKMRAVLDAATDEWGLKVTRVEIKNIQPPKEIEEVMTKQMRAERERRQTVLEAQAHQEAVVARAKGDKEAKELAAEAESNAQIFLARGRAESIKLVYEAQAEGIEKLNKADVSEGVLRLKGLEALKDVADGQATKIYMPTDIAASVAELGILGDALSDKKKQDGGTIPRYKYRKEKEAELKKQDACVDGSTSLEGVRASVTTSNIDAELAGKAYTADRSENI
jgi:regulator of protease activity HflC (stomatin/prohibitin superfamily)